MVAWNWEDCENAVWAEAASRDEQENVNVNVSDEHVKADFLVYGRVDPDAVGHKMVHGVFGSGHHLGDDSLNFVPYFLFLAGLAIPLWLSISPLWVVSFLLSWRAFGFHRLKETLLLFLSVKSSEKSAVDSDEEFLSLGAIYTCPGYSQMSEHATVIDN